MATYKANKRSYREDCVTAKIRFRLCQFTMDNIKLNLTKRITNKEISQHLLSKTNKKMPFKVGLKCTWVRLF